MASRSRAGQRLSVDPESQPHRSDTLAGLVPHLNGDVLFRAPVREVLCHLGRGTYGLLARRLGVVKLDAFAIRRC